MGTLIWQNISEFAFLTRWNSSAPGVNQDFVSHFSVGEVSTSNSNNWQLRKYLLTLKKKYICCQWFILLSSDLPFVSDTFILAHQITLLWNHSWTLICSLVPIRNKSIMLQQHSISPPFSLYAYIYMHTNIYVCVNIHIYTHTLFYLLCFQCTLSYPCVPCLGVSAFWWQLSIFHVLYRRKHFHTALQQRQASCYVALN